MKNLVIAVLLLVSAFALAQDASDIRGGTNIPSWVMLERMALDERQNSQINIELSTNVSNEALNLARKIESLWNSGQFESALASFPELALIVGAGGIAIGNSWRTPVPTYNASLWGTDVRIGNRDSIYISCLDIDRATGHLFAVLAFEANGYYWSMNYSEDNGATWSETYIWSAGGGNVIKSLSTVVLGNDCYIAYCYDMEPFAARLRRCNVSDGQTHGFSGGNPYVTVYSTSSPDTVREVAITSNQDHTNDRLYFFGLAKNGDLRYFWDDSSAVTWTEIATGITDAERGLDATCNEGYDTRFLWISYVDTGDTLNIACRSSLSSWTNTKKLYLRASSADYTSIAAYHDTIICFHEYFGVGNYYCRYEVSYNGGDFWNYGIVDDTSMASMRPDVTARGGGGFGVVYRYYSPTREIRYSWRTYRLTSWSSPVSIASYEPMTNKPSIEYLGNHSFGVVYVSWFTPYRAAYFDRTAFCDYLIGDFNGDGSRIGGDVTYGVRYFKGIGAAPPDSCDDDSIHTTRGRWLYVAADCNGDCNQSGADITRLVAYFKGYAHLANCRFFPTALPSLLKTNNLYFERE